MNTKYHWMNWIATMLKRLRKGELEGVAAMLACCLPFESTDVDKWGEDRMFKHPELSGLHQQIWDHMKPMIVPEAVEKVKNNLRSRFGWQIK
jgi:hypothetical protein